MRSARSEWIKVLEAGIFALGLIVLGLAHHQLPQERASTPSGQTTAALDPAF